MLIKFKAQLFVINTFFLIHHKENLSGMDHPSWMQIDEQMDRWIDGLMDGWVDKQMGADRNNFGSSVISRWLAHAHVK